MNDPDVAVTLAEIMTEVMTDLFEVEVAPDENRVSLHLQATPGSSFAESLARRMLESRGFHNSAFEAAGHQVGQGSRVCAGLNARGEQVGPHRAADSFPALEGKVYFDLPETTETEAAPQESVEVESVEATAN